MTEHDDTTCAWGKTATVRHELEVTAPIIYCTAHQATLDKALAGIEQHMIPMPGPADNFRGILTTVPGAPARFTNLVVDPPPPAPPPTDPIADILAFWHKWENRKLPRTPVEIVADQLRRVTIMPMPIEQLAARIVDALHDHLRDTPVDGPAPDSQPDTP